MNSAKYLVFSASIACFAIFLTVVSPGLVPAQKTMSTGAGSDTRVAYPGYSLKLVFAQRAGPYLAGVDVTIFDEGGKKVVDAYSDGPWFLADLPPGTYKVVAQRKSGPKAAAIVTISEGRQKRAFITW